ncbi:hypothetical protein HDV01_003111 [Terramyces sp. JEL0728]|nr:hypothetical protein HDV01_003111 [Terramyces sp. JEL0728]
MRVSTVALSCITTTVLASGLTPVSEYWTDFQISLGNNNEGSVVVFKIDFDKPVYLTSTSNPSNSVPLTSYGLSVNSTTGFPVVTMLAQGALSLTCEGNGASVNVPNMFPNGPMNGPPPNFMVAPPTGDPGSTIVNSVIGGVRVNETFFPNRLGIAFVVASPNVQSLIGHSCVVTGLTSGAYRITSADGTPWTTPLNVTWHKPRCVYSEVTALIEAAQAISDLGSNITVIDQVNSIQNMVMVLNTREAFYGCQNMVYSFATIGTVNFTITGSTDCVYPYNDPRWQTDPSRTQCCAPKSSTGYSPILTGLNAEIITHTCLNPGKISALMSDFAQVQARIALLPNLDLESLWNTYSGALSDCQTTVYQTQCTLDTDCAYSGQCGSNSMCVSTDRSLMYQCLFDIMSDDLRTELLHEAGLPKTGHFSQDGRNFYNFIKGLGLVYDCVGPTGWNYRRGYQQQGTDDQGNPNWVYVPANEYGCLMDKQCTYEPWNRRNESQCLHGQLPGFCGQTDGTNAQPLSRFAQCQISMQDLQDSACASYGGVTAFDNNCVLPSRNTSSTCLTGPTCRASQAGSAWGCGGNVCYNATATTPQNCTYSYKMYWDQDRSVCAYGVMYNETSCTAAGLTFLPGLFFNYGYYDSPAKCPNSTCSDQQQTTLYSDPANYLTVATNQTYCNDIGTCNVPCARCQSFGGYDYGVCIDSNYTSQSSCNSAGGQWQNSQSTSLCLLTSLTQAACTNSTQTWSDCNNLGQYGCSNSPFSQALNCHWNSMTNCIRSAQCMASGTCNDYEYSMNGQNSGVCVYPNPSQGSCPNGDQNTRNGNCISHNINSQNTCASSNYTWTTRATNAAACAAYGGYCLDPRGRMSFVNTTACTACGGKYYDFYQWQNPRWSPTQMKTTQWIPVEYSSENQYVQVVDDSKAQQYFQNAIGRMIARMYINQLNIKFRAYGSIYEAVACDCIANLTTCFVYPVTSPIDSCLADPSSNSTCSGITIPQGLFNTSNAVTIIVNYVSNSAFVNSALGSNYPLAKRTDSSNNVAVITDIGGDLVGQLVGNGQQYTFSSMPTSAVPVCLNIDLSIYQNTGTFPVMDFVNMQVFV